MDLLMPRAWKKVTIAAEVLNEDGTPVPGGTVNGYEVKNRSSVEPMSAVTAHDGTVILPVYDGQEYYLTALMQRGAQQRGGGPVRFTARDGLNVGVVKIEHPWGKCLAIEPNFHP